MDSILGLLGTVGGAIINGISGNSAAQEQAKSNQAALDQQQKQYQTGIDLLKPQIDTGNTARDYASGILGLPGGADPTAAINAIKNGPGYQFGLNEGVNARDQGAANAGTLNSGAQAKALTQYGQDYAGSKIGSYYDRLMSLANGGSAATGQAVQLGQGDADRASALLTQGGDQRAGAYAFQGANANQGINNAAGGLSDLYGQLFKSSAPKYAAAGQALY